MSNEVSEQEQAEVRAAFLDGVDSCVETVEWRGKKADVHPLSMAQNQYITRMAKTKDGEDSAKRVAYTLIESVYYHGTKKKMFGAADVSKLTELQARGSSLVPLSQAVTRVNGVPKEEAVEKNFDQAPLDASSSS